MSNPYEVSSEDSDTPANVIRRSRWRYVPAVVSALIALACCAPICIAPFLVYANGYTIGELVVEATQNGQTAELLRFLVAYFAVGVVSACGAYAYVVGRYRIGVLCNFIFFAFIAIGIWIESIR